MVTSAVLLRIVVFIYEDILNKSTKRLWYLLCSFQNIPFSFSVPSPEQIWFYFWNLTAHSMDLPCSPSSALAGRNTMLPSHDAYITFFSSALSTILSVSLGFKLVFFLYHKTSSFWIYNPQILVWYMFCQYSCNHLFLSCSFQMHQYRTFWRGESAVLLSQVSPRQIQEWMKVLSQLSHQTYVVITTLFNSPTYHMFPFFFFLFVGQMQGTYQLYSLDCLVFVQYPYYIQLSNHTLDQRDYSYRVFNITTTEELLKKIKRRGSHIWTITSFAFIDFAFLAIRSAEAPIPLNKWALLERFPTLHAMFTFEISHYTGVHALFYEMYLMH